MMDEQGNRGTGEQGYPPCAILQVLYSATECSEVLISGVWKMLLGKRMVVEGESGTG